MSYIIVFGKKLNKDGSLHQKFQHRLDAAISLIATREKVTKIIISGGKTREDCPSEAQAGKEYLLRKSVAVPIEIEEKSQTTLQNLAEVEALVSGVREEILVVISQSSYERVSVLCGHYFPNLYERIQLIQAGGGFAWRDFVLNLPFKLMRICLPLNFR